jgi:hypothetical protein
MLTIFDLNVSSVNTPIGDRGSVDAATLANNWRIGIEATKRTLLVTIQMGVIQMIHPKLMKQ